MPMSDLQQSLRRFLTAAEELESAAPPEDDPQRHGVGARLRNSVVRPLRQAHRGNAGGNGRSMDEPEPPTGSGDSDVAAEGSGQDLGHKIWELARVATELRVEFPHLPELAEATAALQDLAV